jgi:hypothetical protein
MTKFKTLVNTNIDLVNDPFIKKSKEILSIFNPKLEGSYIKYGKEKSCDLDMKENLNANNRNELLKKLLDKLINYQKKIKIILIKFYFDDIRIKNILNSIGYLNGLLEIKDCNLDFEIDKTLPSKIKDKIIKRTNKLKNKLNITNYLKLYRYLHKLNIQSWKLSEFINGEKNINGRLIKLYDTNFTDMYIEVLIDDYRVSNYISFNKENKTKSPYYTSEIDDLINNKEIFYYYILKKIQVFLKWAYFNRIFKEKYLIDNVADTYNEIYDFREEIGNKYYKLCMLGNLLLINKEDKLKDKYKIEFDKINTLSKNLYDKISKHYSKYLNLYLRFN